MADTARTQTIPKTTLKRLREARGFVCDMDGTLVLGDRHNQGLRPLPGAHRFMRWLKERGTPYVLFTNGTTRTPADYAQILRKVDFDVHDDQVMTPASSAVDVFLRRGYKKVMVLGREGLARPLREAGIETIEPHGNETVDAVLVGWFREFRFENLEAGVKAVWNGAKLYSCSQSLYFASAEGKTLGSSRAISVMISDLTGTRIEIVGKPSLHALSAVGRRLKVKLKDLAVIGDDPSLEIPMAHRGKAVAIAVNTGIGDGADFANMPKNQRPHIAVDTIADVHDICRKL